MENTDTVFKRFIGAKFTTTAHRGYGSVISTESQVYCNSRVWIVDCNGNFLLLFHTHRSESSVVELGDINKYIFMLKTKSFDLMDSDGINKLLDVYPLAEGASIFVSEGKICIPFEDGEPENNSHKTIKAKTEINKMEKQISVIEHSNKVLEIIKADLEAKYATADADFKSAPNNKVFEANRKELEDAIRHNENQNRQNVAEIERMGINIKLLTEGI
jgi:hypothetical protein